MSPIKEEILGQDDAAESSSSLRTLLVAVFTGLVFWGSLFALLFFALTS